MRTLHLIYDPYCGWCYGAAPLLEAARGVEGLRIELHGGGMMAGNNRRRMTAELRDFIFEHDQRIEVLTGQRFGEAYRAMLNSGLESGPRSGLDEAALWLDSTPPTMAVVAAGRWQREADMLDRLQRAHFVEGLRIGEARVLVGLAAELGLPREEFVQAFGSEMERAGGHIRESRELLGRVGGRGFPAFAIEQDRHFSLLDHTKVFGKIGAWRIMLMHSP